MPEGPLEIIHDITMSSQGCQEPSPQRGTGESEAHGRREALTFGLGPSFVLGTDHDLGTEPLNAMLSLRIFLRPAPAAGQRAPFWRLSPPQKEGGPGMGETLGDVFTLKPSIPGFDRKFNVDPDVRIAHQFCGVATPPTLSAFILAPLGLQSNAAIMKVQT